MEPNPSLSFEAFSFSFFPPFSSDLFSLIFVGGSACLFPCLFPEISRKEHG